MKKLIFAGGFLGAGKTTLLHCAAKVLAESGNAVGLITNDQAPGLVDTALLDDGSDRVREVSGSCFCCNFPALLTAIDALKHLDYIIAEPVGSCTDLSATILQPIKDRHPDFPLAPLSVLLDPERLPEILGTKKCHTAADALYIQYLQLAEADFIAVNKIDTLDRAARHNLVSLLAGEFPAAKIRLISARTGEGVAQWLGAVESASEAGSHLVEVDYDRYAAGEAALGWFNGTMTAAKPEAGWKNWGANVMTAIHSALRKNALAVGHVKFMLRTRSGKQVFNLVDLNAEPEMTGRELDGESATLILNVRVQAAPRELERLLRDILDREHNVAIDEIHCFAPGRPNPTHRYTHTV